jgi:hypothetical protein
VSVDFEALRMRQRSWCGEGAGGRKIPAQAKLGRGTRESGAVNLGHPPNEHGALSQDADDLTHPVQRTANTRFAVAQHILSMEPNFNSL